MYKLYSIDGFLVKKHIWINKHVNFYRQRYTCCHEIGHYVNGDLHDLPWIPHWKSEAEKKADEYAIACLLPDDRLLDEYEYYEGDLCCLEKVFWVERDVIYKRLSEIKKKPSKVSLIHRLGRS